MDNIDNPNATCWCCYGCLKSMLKAMTSRVFPYPFSDTLYADQLADRPKDGETNSTANSGEVQNPNQKQSWMRTPKIEIHFETTCKTGGIYLDCLGFSQHAMSQGFQQPLQRPAQVMTASECFFLCGALINHDKPLSFLGIGGIP